MTDKPEDEGGGAGQPSGPPQIIDNLFGAEVYADDVAFFANKAGNVSMQLVSGRFDANDGGKLKLVTVGRLVMPLRGAQALAIGLFDYLKKNGLTPDSDPRTAN